MRRAADDRQALEQRCRCITRPALANERVPANADGKVVLKLKTPWRDGNTHLVMSPLEFMQRLAALAPATPPAECEANCAHHHPVRLSRARLLKRVSIWDVSRAQVGLR